jgi:hypothetical protein
MMAGSSPLAMTDREFVEWVAAIRPADAIPSELFTGRGVLIHRANLTPVFERLVRLGVIEQPSATELIVDLLERSQRAARVWLSR